MKLFLYESITGGGLWGMGSQAPPSGSLLAEGLAMIRAVAADLAATSGVEVWALRDARLAGFELSGCRCFDVANAEEEADLFRRLSGHTEATILIAPETGSELANRARLALSAGAKLLSPSPELIELASDKQSTAEFLRAAGISAPLGIKLAAGQPLPIDFPYPAILKPVDGAGSQEVQLIANGQPIRVASALHPRPKKSFLRLERFYPGTAASMAVLMGPAGHLVLPGCFQHLSPDGRFTYLGGKTPLSPDLNARAAGLVNGCVKVLPPTVGYIGFDLVLGAEPSGADDVVIEINPRLTTSYVGLRALAQQNLAAAMLNLAQGTQVELSFSAGPIEFRANGELVS